MLRTSGLLAVLIVSSVCCATGAAEPAAPPAAKAPPPKAARNSFGIQPAGITSPEMRGALERLQQAGVVAGRRGSLTFFRWTTADPPKLAHLGLWGANINNGLLASISALPNLEHVSLYETNVDDQGLAPIARLQGLRTFSVLPVTRYEKAGFGPPQWSYPFLAPRPDRPRITGKVLQTLAPAATLERLDLLDVQLTAGDLSGLAAFPRLAALSLPNAVDDEMLKCLQRCPRLRTLTLGEREITPHELERLAGWKSLRTLTIVHARMSNEALEALSRLETLEELHLTDCGLTDDRLARLKGSAKLASLSLERNEVNGPGLVHLVPLKLTSLGLEFNNISDATLSHLPQLTSLKRLALSYCRQVTDQGIRSGTLQQMTHLEELGLRGMKQVTDASLDDLVKFGHLAHITIRETQIGADAVGRMKAAMPRTVVFK